MRDSLPETMPTRSSRGWNTWIRKSMRVPASHCTGSNFGSVMPSTMPQKFSAAPWMPVMLPARPVMRFV